VFTGIVTHVGAIVRAADVPGGRELAVRVGPLAAAARPGDSIAVDGVCLTVARRKGGTATFTAVRETLDKTTLGERRVGDRVNLEAAARVGDALGGHVVQGHVDGTGTIRKVEKRGADHVVTFAAPRALARGLVEKGSVAADGVSLTVVRAGATSFTVALVPYTLAHTTLGAKGKGARVNVEVDVLGKYVRRVVEEVLRGRKGNVE